MPTSLVRPTYNLARTAGSYLSKIRSKGGPYGAAYQMTEAQRETVPYIQEEARKAARIRGLLQPVEAIFDLLSRGQFMTANIARKITENVRNDRPIMEGFSRSAIEGLTGKVKGDWENVLFGGKTREGETLEGIFPWEPETKAGKFGKGTAGFLANVLLDPLTYFGFGPATGARSAATKYSDDAVRFAFRNLGKNIDDVLPGMVQKGLSKKTLAKKLAIGDNEALQYLAKYGKADLPRYLAKVKKDAYRRALRTPGKELTEELMTGFQKEYKERAGKAVAKGAKDPLEELRGIITGLKKEPYAQAGTRAMRFMRKEFNVGERYPGWLKSMDVMKKRLGTSGIGGRFSDAWWSLLNNPKSKVAQIRKMFHIRNPYQKMLSVLQRDIMSDTSYSMVLKGEKIKGAIDDLSEDEIRAVTGSMVMSQVMQEQAKEGSQRIAISVPEIVEKFGKEGMDIDKVTRAIGEINGITDEWLQFNRAAANAGLADDIGEWMEYLPLQKQGMGVWNRTGGPLYTSRPGFTRARKVGWSGHLQQQTEKLMWMYDIDQKTAQKLLSTGKTEGINLNLESMLMRRAFAQTRFEQRINMIETFREFGINASELKASHPNVYESFVGRWGSFEKLGLEPIPKVKGLEGYLFDTEVAEVLTRATTVSNNDKSLKAFTNALASFTSWWRGWATLSPGFHLRNFYSNNMTGFLKHGVEWMSPKGHLEAFVGTIAGMHGADDAVKHLKNIIPEGTVKEILARRYGGQTIAELAEWGGGKGIISRMTHGFPEAQTYDELIKMEGKLLGDLNVNVFSTKFTPMQASRKLGGYIESTARFQSFLLDFKRSVGQGASVDSSLTWAKNEARKWFIDYGDLCFDSETEILTDRGWQTHGTISKKQKALTFNMQKDCLEWSAVKEVIIYDYKGKLNYWHNCVFDAFCTDEHRWVSIGGPRNGGHSTGIKYRLQSVKDINPSATLKITSKNIKDRIAIYTDDFVELVGWILTEGTYPKGHFRKDRGTKKFQKMNCIFVYQSESHNPHYVKEIRSLAKRIGGIHENKNPIHGDICLFYVNSKLGKIIRSMFPKKVLTMDFVGSLTNKQREILLRTILKGDGTRKKYSSGGEHWVLTQKNKKFVDNFQILAFLVGHRTVIRLDSNDNCYRVAVHRKDPQCELTSIRKERIFYAGKVWCIHTENNTLVARRNGRIYISGNSPFEQKVMKNVIPFYTWLRGNLANQLTGMIQFKEMYAMLPKATEAIKGEGPAKEDLPEWMRELGMFPVGDKGKMFWPNFPYMDVNKIPIKFAIDEDTGVPLPVLQDPWDFVSDIASDAHPILKSIIEYIPPEGVDVFYKTTLGETRKAPRGLRALTKPLVFLDGLMRKHGFEEGLRLDVNNKGQLMMDAKMGKVLENNILPLKMIPKYLDLPELLIPAIEDWKKKALGAVDDYDAIEEFLQTLSFYAGVKMKDLEMEEYEFRRKEEILEKAQKARSKARKKLPGQALRSLEWRQKQERLHKKLGL